MTSRNTQRGASFVGLVLALLVGAALYFGYFEFQGKMSEGEKATNAISGSRAFACRTNRQTLERAITLWSVEHPTDSPTFGDLRAAGLSVPSCPEGGRYSLIGRRAVCSLHD